MVIQVFNKMVWAEILIPNWELLPFILYLKILWEKVELALVNYLILLQLCVLYIFI